MIASFGTSGIFISAIFFFFDSYSYSCSSSAQDIITSPLDGVLREKEKGKPKTKTKKKAIRDPMTSVLSQGCFFPAKHAITTQKQPAPHD
jgi:hypothetical protein